MIREGLSLLLLGALFALLLWNAAYYNEVTDELLARVNEAESLVEMENFSAAKACLLDLTRRWAQLDGYTHVLIRHAEISEMTDAIYAALGDVAAEEPERAKSSLARLREELSSTAAMERLSPGSIF